jgi:hypothetical protein
MVGAGLGVGGLGGRLFLLPQSYLARGRLNWRAGLSRGSATVVDYATPRGTPGQLVGGTVLVQMAEKFKARTQARLLLRTNKFKISGLENQGMRNSVAVPLICFEGPRSSWDSVGHRSIFRYCIRVVGEFWFAVVISRKDSYVLPAEPVDKGY